MRHSRAHHSRTSRNTHLRGCSGRLVTVLPDDRLADMHHAVGDAFPRIIVWVDLVSVSPREPGTKALAWELTPTQPSTPFEEHGQTGSLRRSHPGAQWNGGSRLSTGSLEPETSCTSPSLQVRSRNRVIVGA
ncbi:hypothetical protein BT67DRAFT_390725 [Trichocladium antarcticum]|uniref:Uncharacterized protein n=1 Tax=Trichocladium antarcticum TaxID=1450529 RepID=A0AAN6ZAS9_9PEZI|nr:hypothetical protein BT67DRAFT_390725 [Trichocladium antarcticum]